MSRFAKYRRVFFIEESIIHDVTYPKLEISKSSENVNVIVPHLPDKLNQDQNSIVEHLLKSFIIENGIRNFTSWYYTPMALNFTRYLKPDCCIYDCMDELSKFKGAPEELIFLERELFKKADLVFTGGQSLFEAKQDMHDNIYPFSSGIDFRHFIQARSISSEPVDQKDIPHPRLGFYGVIDERMDIKLLGELATLRPDWHFVIIGPVVKIDPALLPINSNIHYLGKKDYGELPSYLATWDCAIMPFALNDSTRFISPTKTPEFLAAGCPVVSTPIKDVVQPYGIQNLVAIARTAKEFVEKAALNMLQKKVDEAWLGRVDTFLREITWDEIWNRMSALENNIIQKK